ncbi:TlpA disulfide reductase family protein [Alteriqipengyuania flavescens]|uniref:TlpA family protein disulfide reductase n=1 Tax=Alteriqipengyuania flavescens TaxID=3053610 RepID=UPI0025B3F5BA|nr:TlpA disulfide reductase family protein [Alteriqipengyuania flavescens]WJY17876.1 TlpA disulfide reductase family protein [Alteriqipengyuania flavescens]WJY23817.1 TlpA disulfide reductase family protein [Alteriqipengyuania flavescens]
MSLSSSAMSALLLAALLAVPMTACDRQSDRGAQPKENSAPAKQGVAGLDRSAAGSPLPDTVLTDPAGRTLDPGSLEGAPVLVNLWATWCAPCKAEMPTLDALAGEYAGELKVLAVSQDLTGAEAVVPYFEEAGFAKLEPWLDPDADFAGAYGVNVGLPLTVLYDAAGRELWRYSGDRDWTDAESRALVEEALGGGKGGGG